MAENTNLFDEAESRTESPGFGSGDFADWWEPDEDDGEHLVGVVVEKHSAPEDWTEPGEVPDTIYTVVSVGRGDHEAGSIYTPKQHKQLKEGLSGAGIGDVVNIRFTGYEKVQGNMMHTYEVGYIPEAEWSDMDGAEEVRAVIDDHKANNGIWGDNTRAEPYTSSPSGNTGGSGSSEGNEAADYLRDVVDMQNGSISVDKADKMLNDVNDYDVDVEETAVMAGLNVKDGEVTR